ncbi:MAG: RNA polymerase sigma factor [Acetatifactor sp.]|nr:RNA polymerase sigma factor [Acetatifactor sp.]
MESDSDFLLVQKMRMGDETALEEFVVKYYPRIHKYCQLHIDDYDYAEDMTQETFVRFFRTLNQYRHYGKAVNYLYVIAGNVCIDYHRKKKEIPLEELPDIPDRKTDNLDMQIEVRTALESLTDDLREVAVLYFIQEQKQKDIAKILGISLPLVKYRIRRAREMLSAYFKEEWS